MNQGQFMGLFQEGKKNVFRISSVLSTLVNRHKMVCLLEYHENTNTECQVSVILS